MSKKRVNFGSVAVSEAARRELMKPVTCWEQTWVVPEGSKVRVRQWVQTNKQPEWSDDEADAIDQPLAPILDVEVVDMDEDEEGAEGADPTAPTATLEEETTTAGGTLLPPDAPNVPPDADPLAAVSTPQDETEGIDSQAELTLEPTLDMGDPPGFDDNGLTTNVLSADLDTGDLGDFGAVDLSAGLDTGDLTGVDLGPVSLPGVDDFSDLTADPLELLPPDGTAFEAVQDLSQVDEGDQILGGKVMDESGDPFVNIS